MSAARKPSSQSSPGGSGKSSPLHRLGLRSDWDIALHLPLRYEDETRLTPLHALRDGADVTVDAVVTEAQVQGRSPRRQLLVRLRDADSPQQTLTLRLFHFYPNQIKSLQPGVRLRVHGQVRQGLFGWEMVHPSWKTVDAHDPLPTTLTPVYPTTAGLPQSYLRKAVTGALARLDARDNVPQEERARHHLPDLVASLRTLHAPPPSAWASLEAGEHPAQRRLKFDELLAQQLAQQQARVQRLRWKAPALSGSGGDEALPQRLRAALPFVLTPAQERCVAEIAADLTQTAPMHRLLQGDVGSGKTVVAALAAAQAIAAGWQCAIMAPTEILAAQHARKLADWLEPLGVGVAWLSGSQSKKEREAALQRVASGQAQLVLGTHAVIQAQVRFARLGLAIVDEQHRFGVAQRLALRDSLRAGTQDTGLQPHLLMMSATPIPRTLAMALFGDLDVSTIDTLPPGRTPVRTTVLSAERRDDLIARIGALIAQGRQAYWVCPLVEESETLDLQNAVATHAELSAALAALPRAAQQPPLRVGLLHGRMKAAEKRAAMQAFSAGDIGLLVATTVIEVGVDVPNASLMVIEHAERFGLSQLHQLRGRVGRGAAQSDCVLLFTPPLSPTARERLAAMRELSDGFALAQKDLELRGPGELLGLRQSGVPGLRYADLAQDADLLEAARDTAQRLLQNAPDAARQHVALWLGEGFDWLSA
ncbi:ATP-dependent DNA helicase RecG [Thiomonas bhubaneswarensis]|uniref:ATP-dependent DNA helicase RecG n=1 Tax=Thiomonas bhubaneswarensis TaxID=339866 RepID=A0A0K6HTZ6_9BURK|nr:ATP-dependent DNA helicase RecG [Thiomonas bhubaneswarensis]CUA94400.1 ATP-dependent DNA helicase RecG [Thiomonas bhubaneswarensis]